MSPNDAWLTVTDVRQWLWCPRVVYFTYVMPVDRLETSKMGFGRQAEMRQRLLERRRSLRRYGIDAGRRVFDCPLESPTRRLRGKVDLLICQADRVIPVEWKLTGADPGGRTAIQLAAYGLLAEEQYQLPAPFGILVTLPSERARRVALSQQRRRVVDRVASEMRQMISHEEMPAATRSAAKCGDCELRLFCGDV